MGRQVLAVLVQRFNCDMMGLSGRVSEVDQGGREKEIRPSSN
jgi:hypothetical protein